MSVHPSLSRIEKEKRMVAFMIGLYCRLAHHHKREMCSDCDALCRYALERLDRCPFGEAKPACRNCRVHCYNPAMRLRVRHVMRVVGPLMFFVAPVEAYRHAIGKRR